MLATAIANTQSLFEYIQVNEQQILTNISVYLLVGCQCHR